MKLTHKEIDKRVQEAMQGGQVQTAQRPRIIESMLKRVNQPKR